jgi:DNA-binding MarR family transcriptional regulator
MESSTPPADFYRAEDYCPEESFGYLMKQILASMVRQANDLLEPCNLTSAQRGLLMRLKMEGRSTVTDIARALQVDAGATTRLVDRLVHIGQCQRARSSADRREVMVELTREGETAIAALPAVLCRVMNDHLSGFSNDELNALKRYLQRISKNGETLRPLPTRQSTH